MLKQGTVSDLITLSPDRKLFEDWISKKHSPSKLRRMVHKSKRYPTRDDHQIAFEKVHFEKRFDLTDKGYQHLHRLAELSLKQDVFLICQCHEKCRCHREMLLIMAKKIFKVPTAPIFNSYPIFEKKIPAMRKHWKTIQA